MTNQTIIEAAFAGELKRIEEDFRRFELPPRMFGGVKRYLVNGLAPGHFLTAVLSNDMAEAVNRADDQNVNLLPQYMKFFYNCVPGGCWGTPEKVELWIERGGWQGDAQ